MFQDTKIQFNVQLPIWLYVYMYNHYHLYHMSYNIYTWRRVTCTRYSVRPQLFPWVRRLQEKAFAARIDHSYTQGGERERGAPQMTPANPEWEVNPTYGMPACDSSTWSKLNTTLDAKVTLPIEAAVDNDMYPLSKQWEVWSSSLWMPNVLSEEMVVKVFLDHWVHVTDVQNLHLLVEESDHFTLKKIRVKNS